MIHKIIQAAHINANLGRRACRGFARNQGLDMRLVRLACQLEAGKRVY